jgi:general secretion pathway protein D
LKTNLRFLAVCALLAFGLAGAARGELPGQGSSSGNSSGGVLGLGLFGGGSGAAPASDPFLEANRGPLQNPPLDTAPPLVAQANFNPTSGQPQPNPMGGAPAGARRLPPAGTDPYGPVPAAMPYGGVVQAGGAPSVPSAPVANNPQRAQCDALLVQARVSLANGDLRMAAEKLNQAKSMGVQYGAQDDSPAKVEAVLARYREVEQFAMQARQTGGDTLGIRQRQAQLLLEQAEALINWRQLEAAEKVTRNAESLGVNFTPYEKNPREIYSRIAQARNGGGVQQAVFNQNAPPPGGAVRPYDTNVTPVQGFENRGPYELPSPGGGNSGGPVPPGGGGGPMPPAMRLYVEGEQALQMQQMDRARQLFLQAESRRGELDPATAGRVRDRLNFLGRGAPVLDEVAQRQQLLRRKASMELANAQSAARRLQQANPLGAMRVLQEARVGVTRSGLDPQAEGQLLNRVDQDIRMMDQFIKANQGRIQLDARNAEVKDGMRRERQWKVEVQERLARMVDDFNKLMDQQRWREAELIARQAEELAPEEPVVRQLKWTSRFARNLNMGEQIRDDKARGYELALEAVDESSTPFNDRSPREFPKNWEALKKKRGALGMERRRSAKELEIEQKLRTPVSLRFEKAPLQEVMDYLAKMADVNLHLDPLGLSAEGVGTDTPVTINLTQGDISLKSALQLVLEPLHLGYVIKDEVLKVTSAHLKDGEVYTVTYNVADLVIPIPNFVPTVNMGLTGALQEAYRQTNMTGIGGAHAPVVAVASQNGGSLNGKIGDNVLANLAQMGGPAPGFAAPGRINGGPGGLSGGSQPDFDPLTELIVSTISPQTWEEVGGPGRVARFENNLSLVISQTQDVHDQIADLLSQLRRLQDLQVTIEVRFISLNDNFFERIGVDFDFDIDDDTDQPFSVFGKDTVGANDGDATDIDDRDLRDRDHGPGVTVGLSAPGVFSADLDVPVQQGSFQLAVPQFGNFAPGAGAQVGFAILSDLEAFFFIEASQGDRRSNVLQAPKVTLFNGQEAVVSDVTQSPFVISVVPVVGDFAAAQQPVIAVLSEGTFLNVQAVVSNDRRFVRLTVVPFFSTIGDVDTFTFDGSQSVVDETNRDLNNLPIDNPIPRTNRRTTSRQGTTVQLPSFSFITVTTTVSVPDGGTVLLGGIKRLSEGRNEFGVPILNKVPYVNRLFKNVGIGRETQSLLMMVTPRIIIQEEEEELL